MNYHCLALFAFLCVAAPVHAALPAELDKPYQMDVVLQVGADRVLTEVFKQQLARELNDLLRQAFGNLAQVTVKTGHPHLPADGDLLQALATLKAGPIKTHVLRVGFVDGQFYQIESAQHDGLTGLVSPVVKHIRTADRPLVGKLAAELVHRDLGLTGSVVDARNPERVKVALKGGRLGGDRLVNEGDVFAIVQVGRAGSQVVPEAYLQAVEEPKDGMVACLLLARFGDDASKLKALPGGFLGYRCLKLGAVQGPLRLRLVDDQGQPLHGLRVEVARASSQPSREAKGLTDRDGLVDARATYDRLALVWVLHQGTAKARIPVPIFADRVAVCRVRIDTAGQVHDSLRLRQRALGDLVNGLLLVTNQLFRDLNELTRAGQHAEALARARAGLKVIQQSLPELHREYAGLRGEIVRLLPAAEHGRLLDASGMKQLETAQANLESFVAAQQEVLNELARRQEAQAEVLNLINQARLARDQADYDDAIPLYEKALARAGQHAKLAQELASLKARWGQVGGPLHRRAREFLYRVWARIDNADQLQENLEEVKKQLAICQEQNDVLALTKFLVIYPAQAKRLEMLLSNQRRDTEEGFKRFEKLDALAEELVKLHKEVSEFVLEKAGK
jgi:tetratricopeptide (TPR) repeat protein